MKKILTLTIIAIFMLTGTCFSKMRGGSQDGFKMPHGKWWRLPSIQKSLNVTPDEQKKLDQLYTESRKRMIDLKATVEKEKLDLEVIMDSEIFNKSACLKQFQSLANAKTKLGTERFSFITEIRALFGQERYLKLSAKHQAIKQGCGKKNAKNCPARAGKTSAGILKAGCPGQSGQ